MTGAHEVTQAVAVVEDGQLEQAPEALLHLRAAVRAGVPWHQALLQAVGLWTAPEEVYQDRTYLYLIKGEAFDWLVLAERLCVELDGYIPAEDRELLLFQGKLPVEVTPENFKELLGANKYSGYLNYCYGIVVEEALQLAVEEEVRKRHRARGYSDSEDFVEEAFTLLYGDTRTALLDQFRKKELLHRRRTLTLANVKQFTYWLFKLRVNLWDPARVASDTRKGLRRLRSLEPERADF